MFTVAAFILLRVSQTAPCWSLRTEDTRIQVSVRGGQPVIIRLGNTSGPEDWCQDTPVPLIDHAWVPAATPVSWEFASGRLSEHGQRLTLQFHSKDGLLGLNSVWRARPGLGPIEHSIFITNHSRSPIAIPQQDSLTLSKIQTEPKSQIVWTRRGASNALTEGGVFESSVEKGLKLDLQSDNHVPNSPVPWLAVQTGDRRGLYAGWEFSGRGGIRANAADATSLDIQIGLPANFKTDINPGESLEIPTAFVGCYRGDLDDGSYALHQFIQKHLRARVPKGFTDPAMILGLYLDAGADHAKEADVLRCEKFAQSIGLDVFMPDAMWFPACGDWRWDPSRFPNGASPIERAVHGDVMKFGLWCAWNNGGISTDPGALSVRGPVGHPDWFPYDLNSNWNPGPFYGESACMGSDEARRWAIKKTQSMIGDWKVDILKTDVHPIINDCSRTDHRHHFGVDASYWSTKGVYEVWDKLRARYPSVVLENCSGASHIKDFGVIQRCAYTAVTDTLSNLPDRCGVYDSTYVLPPSALLTYTYENGYGFPGDDPGPYLVRSGMMTAWNLAPTNSKGWTPEYTASVKGCVRSYKEWIRPILQDCKVHHILPRPDGKRWDGMFFWSKKLGAGACFVFRPDSLVESQTVKLAGLDRTTRYRVWCEDGSLTPFETSGAALIDEGLKLALPSRYSSDLVHIQEARHSLPAGWSLPVPVGSVNAAIGKDGTGTTAKLDWQAVPTARCYRVTVATRADMSNPRAMTIAYANQTLIHFAPSDSDLYCRIDTLAWGGSALGTVTRVHLP